MGPEIRTQAEGPSGDKRGDPERSLSPLLAAFPERPQTKILPANLGFNEVMRPGSRPIIPIEAKHPWFDAVRPSDHDSAVELLVQLASQAPAHQVVMRWAGGCKGLDEAQVESLFRFIAEGHVSGDGRHWFQGAVGSGGTREAKADGSDSVMITQLPYFLARLFDCVAWSSTPLTARARLDSESGALIVSKHNTRLDPRGHLNVLTETDVKTFQGWNGDVRWYLGAMESMAQRGYKTALGVVNGGDVTKDEALLALSKNIPVIIVEGSGRAADELAAAARAGNLASLYQPALMRGTVIGEDRVPNQADFDRLVHLVQLSDPKNLSRSMDGLGLLTAA